jgi:hypothetical protein
MLSFQVVFFYLVTFQSTHEPCCQISSFFPFGPLGNISDELQVFSPVCRRQIDRSREVRLLDWPPPFSTSVFSLESS